MELTSQDSKLPELMIDAKTAAGQGYTVAEPAPEAYTCQFCGAQLHWIGLVSLVEPSHIWQWINPAPCSCERATALLRAQEAMRKAEEEARRQKAEQERMQSRVNRLIGESGMRGRFQQRTFENFTVTDGNRAAHDAAKAYAERFKELLPITDEYGRVKCPAGKRNGLYFVGGVGTGKTHLSAAIANRLLAQGTPVVCMTMIDLLARIKQTFDRGGESEEAIMGLYQEVPLLIIDDMGKEQATAWGVKTIYAIVNARYEAYMPTIVTTNYGNQDLIRRMTPRGEDNMTATATLDRLYEMCKAVPMTGQSWRVR